MQASVRQLSPWVMVALATYAAAGPAATQLVAPALPALETEFGVAPAVAQLTISLSFLTMAVATLAWGRGADRFGRHRAAVAGLILFTIGSMVCAIAPDIRVLIIGRILQAAGGTCGVIVTQAVVRDVYGPERAASMLARVSIAVALAPMAAAFAGGMFAEGLGWRTGFGLTAATGIALLQISPRAFTGAEHRELGAAPPVWTMLARESFRWHALQSAFAMGVFFAFTAGAPRVVTQVLDYPAVAYGAVFAAAGVAFVLGNLVSAWQRGSASTSQLLLLSTGASAIAALIMGALMTAGWWNLWTIFLPVLVIAFGVGIATPLAQAAALDAGRDATGTASGVLSFLQLVVGAVVAAAIGVAGSATPYPLAFAMIVLTTLGCFAALRERRFQLARVA